MGLLTIVELSRALGITVRRLRTDVKDGLKPSSRGPRGVQLFDLRLARAWRAANRRSVPGEGRPRKPVAAAVEEAWGGKPKATLAGVAARLKGLEGRNGRAFEDPEQSLKTPVGLSIPAMDLAGADQDALVDMVRRGDLNAGNLSVIQRAVQTQRFAMGLKLESGRLLAVADVRRSVLEVLSRARAVLDQVPDAIVSEVSGIVPLTDAQRRLVRDAARDKCDELMDALASLGTGSELTPRP